MQCVGYNKVLIAADFGWHAWVLGFLQNTLLGELGDSIAHPTAKLVRVLRMQIASQDWLNRWASDLFRQQALEQPLCRLQPLQWELAIEGSLGFVPCKD